MPQQTYRRLFDIPAYVHYLNCAYMSPQLRSVTSIGHEAVDRKTHPWDISPQAFFEDCESLRTKFAQIICGDGDGVAIVPSASYGLQIAVQNLGDKTGKNILVLSEQFPSNVYPWIEAARTNGGKVVEVTRGDGGWTPSLLRAIGPDTGVVAVPHCHWTDGSLVDLEKVRRDCDQVGAALVVDASQSLGAMPFDINKIRPDFVVSVGYKWLFGPYATALMWVAPEYREGTPIEHNWINREGSDDFARLVEYRDSFQVGARRFDVGEKSNFVLVPMLNRALDQILSWGVGNTAASLGQLTGDIAERAKSIGLEVDDEEERSPHMIGLRFPGEVPAGLSEDLIKRRIYVSFRSNSMRVSPHLYNTIEEGKMLVDAISGHLK